MLERRFTDPQIHQAVIEELKWDTLVDETDVGVQVEDGVVTLTGTVKSFAEKHAALNAAFRVAGVTDVANDIEVKVPGDMKKTDTEIAQAVRHALEADVLVPAERIHSIIAAGVVALNGTVGTIVQRDLAERAVRHLAGVRGVMNQIRVVAPEADPNAVREAVEAALDRQAEREAEKIDIEIEGGKLKISGPIRSWHARRAVIGAAGHAPGVTSVEDHLYVDLNP